MALGIRSRPSLALSFVALVCLIIFWRNGRSMKQSRPQARNSLAMPKMFSPFFRANCFGCHQDAKKLGGYLMTKFDAMVQGGESESKAIVPGKSSDSHLLQMMFLWMANRKCPRMANHCLPSRSI